MKATLKIILKNFSVGAIKAENGALGLTSEDDPSSLTYCSSRLGPLALVLLMIPKCSSRIINLALNLLNLILSFSD